MKFKGIAVSVLALAPVLFGRPSSGETLDHGVQEPKTMPQLACAGVPADAVFIPSVSRVWAIQQADQVRLVFSNQPLSCAAALSGASAQAAFDGELANLSVETCSDGWTKEFGVADARPGVFDLAEVGISPTEAMTRVEVQQSFGCNPSSECRVVITGSSLGGSVPSADGGVVVNHGPDATLEIYSVSEECLSGRLSNFKSLREFPPPPDMNGVFVAQWCSAE
jgi:hypothetical protein